LKTKGMGTSRLQRALLDLWTLLLRRSHCQTYDTPLRSRSSCSHHYVYGYIGHWFHIFFVFGMHLNWPLSTFSSLTRKAERLRNWMLSSRPKIPKGASTAFRKTYASRDDGKEVDGTGNLEWEGWIWRG
jgi:hypothetical protein